MRNLKCALLALGIALSAAPAAEAAIESVASCDAVLIKVPFKTGAFSSNSYLQQIAYSRFMSSTFESSKSDTSFGGVAIGAYFMGSLDYDKSSYDAVKKSMEDVRFSKITQINESRSLISSGDPDILKSWNQCIRDTGGGLTARFETRTATEVTLVIEWASQGNKNSTKLDADVQLYGVDLKNDVSYAKCFKKGTKIVEGVGCRSNIRLKDAWTPLAVTIQAKDGSTDAFVPPRIKLVNERRAIPTVTDQRDWFRKGFVNYAGARDLTSNETSEGWTYDPRATAIYLSIPYNAGSMNYCNNAWQSTSAYAINYGYTSMSHTRGHSGWTIVCRLDVKGELIRSRWVADTIAPPKEPDEARRPPAA